MFCRKEDSYQVPTAPHMYIGWFDYMTRVNQYAKFVVGDIGEGKVIIKTQNGFTGNDICDNNSEFH